MKVVVVFFLTLCIFQLAFAQLDSSKVVVIGQTTFSGNEKTKEFVLLRELTYTEGDTLSTAEFSEKLKRSEENLFNTKLFNKVSSVVSYSDSSTVEIVYQLEERWYFWPYPILENADRNFNVWWQTKDFQRLTYGIFLNAYNFRGRNETLQFMFKVGFENQFSIGYDIPNLNQKKTLGLYLAGGYSEFKEVNYASEDNKRNFFKSEEGPGRQVIFGKVNLTYRKSLNVRHTVGLAYTHIQVDSAILDLTDDYLKNNQSQTEFLSVHYYGKYDTRDYIEYPLTGFKVELYASAYGLGLLQNENLNLVTTTGGINWHVALTDRWYFANSVVGKLSFFDNPPYALQQGLGYQNTVRGYEFYVMDAQNYAIAKTNLKYNILKKREFHLGWLPSNKFNKPYLAMFINGYFDMGYASDQLYATLNPLSNKLAMGYGLGIDFTSFYDFVMRIEYSFNREGEHGFFLHFKKSI